MKHIEIGESHLLIPDVIARRPVLIIHGGGWRWGEPKHMLAFARPLVAAGHPCYLLRYRTSEMAPWPAMREDCVAGLEQLCAGLDGRIPAAEKAFVIGASAGGHLALVTSCARPELVAGTICASGPRDINTRAMQNGEIGENWRIFFGGEPSPEQWRDATPQPAPGAPPLLVLHSTGDMLVPFAYGEEACAAWRAVGSPTMLASLPGGGPKDHALFDDDLANDDPLAGNDLERRVLRPYYEGCIIDWCARH